MEACIVIIFAYRIIFKKQRMPENDIDNKPVTSKRDIFLESIRGRYPDLDLSLIHI